MRQMVRRALPYFPVRIQPQILADPVAALVLVKHHDAVGAHIRIDQREMQVRDQRQRLAPIGPQVRLAAHGSAGIEAHGRNPVRGHLGLLGIERQHALEIARIPGGDPFMTQAVETRGIVGRRHGFLLFWPMNGLKPN
jgi:hypothetical protein